MGHLALDMDMPRWQFQEDEQTITVEASDDQVSIDADSKGPVTVEIEDGYVVDEQIPEWAEGVLDRIGINGVVRP
jgi:hypothetical protein